MRLIFLIFLLYPANALAVETEATVIIEQVVTCTDTGCTSTDETGATVEVHPDEWVY